MIRMETSQINALNITENDIDKVEALFGNVTFDKERREIIKNLSSIDVQAFPGSGKTTALVAKLAILAGKWFLDNRGICVLSHTDAARDEIEDRLGKASAGRKLLSYPHFIGTFHGFFDTFVSIPWLRSNGYSIKIIDSDIVLKKRWNRLKPSTKYYLENRRKTEYACESIRFPVSIDIGCGELTPCYTNVKKVVEDSQKEGYFTYNEMLHIAQYVLEQNPAISRIIQTRFPLLFIDEAQDTSSLQWALIDAAFKDKYDTIIQAFGDSNQAIFQSYNKDDVIQFPKQNTLTMSNSHRFGKSIAEKADTLSIAQKGMTGEYTAFTKNDDQHTIFLFDKKNVKAAITAYAKQILNCFTDEEIIRNEKYGCYVIGMVHNTQPESSDTPHFPVGLRDYLIDYEPSLTNSIPKPEHFIDYFILGKAAQDKSYNFIDMIESISCGFLRIINTYGGTQLSSTRKAYNVLLSSLPANAETQFRKLMLILINMPFSVEEEWNSIVTVCKQMLWSFWKITDIPDREFLWKDHEYDNEQYEKHLKAKNTFQYFDELTGRTVTLHFASIHSVKGRTHLSTMIVETYWYDHNIQSIIPWLCKKPPKRVKERDKKRLKCHYVGLTRARGLICIAIPKEFLTELDILLLEESGWNIVYVM